MNRWLSVRFNLLSAAILGLTGIVSIMTPRIDASLAGFALAFASTVTNDVRSPVLWKVGLCLLISPGTVDSIPRKLYSASRFSLTTL